MLCWLGLSSPLYKSSVAQPKTSVSIQKSSSQQQNSRGEVVQSWEINIYFLTEILFEIRVYFVGFLDLKAFHILGVFWEQQELWTWLCETWMGETDSSRLNRVLSYQSAYSWLKLKLGLFLLHSKYSTKYATIRKFDSSGNS